MKSPNFIRIEPQRSVVYGSAVLLSTILLIALRADFMSANSQFGLKNGLWLAAAAGVTLWAWVSAWRVPKGHLNFSQGQWTWQRAEQEHAGTLQLHIDLPNYMLVRFQPALTSRTLFGRIFSTTAPWFHLEARHFSATAQSAGNAMNIWLDVRRAVVFPSAISSEPISLKAPFNEKPAR